jgi:quinol-cytochrome oxidoreductase complex cytochrome b subunit
MMCVFIFVSIILAIVFPVGLGDPADPTDNLFIPKPEWYFLALYQLLKYFPGKFEIIATAIIPSGGIIALLLIPLIDKNPEIRPTKRPIAMALGFITVVALVVLTLIGVKS